MTQYYDIKTYKQYDRDVKLAVRRGLDMEQLLMVVDMLRKGETLPPKYHNHLLYGDYKGYWECHISPDWLLLYEKDTEIRIISLYLFVTFNAPIARNSQNFFVPLHANIQLKYVFIMARPIKETPVLKGKDVERFKYNLEHPTPVSAEEVTKARETYEKFKRITTFVL